MPTCSGPMAFSTIDSEHTGVFLCLCGLAFLEEDRGEIVEALGHVGMVRPQRFLADRQRSPVETLGIGTLALIKLEPCKPRQARDQPGMIGDQQLLVNQSTRLASWLPSAFLP